MPEPGPTSFVVSTFVHATEDEEKVLNAIKTLLVGEVWEAVQIKRKSLRGHFHNPLLRVTVTLSDHSLIVKTLKFIGSQISPQEREYLQQSLDLHYDGKRQLFLRFDKQASARGTLRFIKQGDSIRCVVKFSGRHFNIETLRVLCHSFNLL
ncbi:MAG: RNA-binding domain-containing protein [Promethearchaeota archaeon]